MVFQIYIKTFYFIVAYIFLLTSCGIIGGDDKVDASENSVLSGPPLAIPPEFDIDSQLLHKFSLHIFSISFEQFRIRITFPGYCNAANMM